MNPIADENDWKVCIEQIEECIKDKIVMINKMEDLIKTKLPDFTTNLENLSHINMDTLEAVLKDIEEVQGLKQLLVNIKNRPIDMRGITDEELMKKSIEKKDKKLGDKRDKEKASLKSEEEKPPSKRTRKEEKEVDDMEEITDVFVKLGLAERELKKK